MRRTAGPPCCCAPLNSALGARMHHCRLCLQPAPLCASHVIPEFLYSDLYNDKGHMMGIHGRGKKGWKPLQKGLTEKLLCDTCEQYLSKHFETPFHRSWVAKSLLPSPWPLLEPHVVRVDYTNIKLFHLSVLWRASVSTLGTFNDVRLGPHEDRIRQMLLARDPGPAWLYPVMGLVLIKPDARTIVQMITMPLADRFEGHRCYTMAYGGVHWWTAVASHKSHDWMSASLTESGDWPLVSVPWTQLGEVHAASLALKRAGA